VRVFFAKRNCLTWFIREALSLFLIRIQCSYLWRVCFIAIFLASGGLTGILPGTSVLAQTTSLPPIPAWHGLGDSLFQHWSTGQGLAHEIVTALAQDGDGFIWVGTQGGLSRWDGYRFKHYQKDPKDPNSLPDSYVEVLHTDRLGRLWVGTSSAGLAMYDKVNDQFVVYRAGPQGLSHVAVRALLDDGQNGLWIGTDAGIDHLQFSNNQIKPTSLISGVTALMIDKNGYFWAGTRQSLLRRKADSRVWEVQSLPIDDGKPANISILMQDEQGVIWLGSKQHGAYFLPPGGSKFIPLEETPVHGPGVLKDRWVTQIIKVAPDQLWIGTFGHGIVHWDGTRQTARRIVNQAAIPASLAHNNIMTMLRDRSGLLWIGSQRGLQLIDPQQTSVITLLGGRRPEGVSDVDVRCILEAADGRIWLGLGNNGVDIFDPRQGRVGALRIDQTRPLSALPTGRVNALAQDHLGMVYIATDRGLYRANADGSNLRRLAIKGRIGEEAVRALYFEGKTLWVGTKNDGVWQYHASPDGPASPASFWRPPGLEKLSDERVIVILKDGVDGLWVGTRNGLNRVRPDQVPQQILPEPLDPQALPAGLISDLLIDKKGRLWVASQGGGIAILQNTHGKPRFQRLGLSEGLPNMNVDKILSDQTGQIWASTDAGLVSINLDSLKVSTIRAVEGVHILGYWSGAGITSKEGDLLFGGAGGLTVVKPTRRQTWRFQAPVLITDVRSKGKSVHALALNQAVNGVRPLQLDSGANSLTVEFAALDYSAPALNRYAWRMDGYDTDWIETDASRRSISYTNLSPGSYRLRMRGSNRNGEWTQAERVLPLQVKPAWYQTWYWYVTCAVFGIGLLWQASYLRTRVLRRRQRELEQQIEQSTRQLRKQHAELLHQAKLASLGTLTAGVAHEINNPTNFALVGSYNMAHQLTQFHDVLVKLAGEDATPDLIELLNQHFAVLGGSLAAISEGTERIRDLVKDLRTFSRLEESDIKSVRVTDSLRATIHLVSGQYAGDMLIECEFAANPVLECSPAQLNQVFMNLMVNARQAISIRAPELRAQVAGRLVIRSFFEEAFFVLEFEDNGVGIPVQDLNHVFDPFFTTKGVGQGMGMGLSVAFGIMEQHRGSISVRSRVGVGTCFALRLPWQAGSDQAEPESEPGQQSVEPDQPGQANQTNQTNQTNIA
jgi:ligand-binding sensor domain-containing protein/signal transduction histidine kinase